MDEKFSERVTYAFNSSKKRTFTLMGALKNGEV